MDDVAVMSNCSQKTAGILGDDLAVNAEKLLFHRENFPYYRPLQKVLLNTK
jgi:predicted DNA repair protein MutK